MVRWIYDLMYRRGAPWEIGPRSELVALVEDGDLDPETLPRAIDVGCGTGANPVFLAESGFDVVGVDFSPVALDKARALAAERGVADRCRFVEADLTAGIDALDVDGPFDLVVDYGTLDDLRGRGRDAMTQLIIDLTRPGSRFLIWCFQADPKDLPLISFKGPSRISPGLRPDEQRDRFGAHFDIERLPEPPPDTPFGCYLMTRRTGGVAQ